MPSKSLGFKCPECGRDYGRLMLKIKRIRKKKYQWPKFKMERDHYGNETKVPIKRAQHSYRYLSLSLFAGNTADPPAGEKRAVIINPPRPEPNEDTEAYKAISEVLKRYMLIVQMIPHVHDKYPSLKYDNDPNRLEEAIRGCKTFSKYIDSTTDDRYHRSLDEWMSIVKTAIEESPRKASKKYPGMTADGKVIRLSQEYIRDRIPKVKEFAADFSKYVLVFFESIPDVIKAIQEDPELMEKYKKYEEDYDNKRRGGEGGEERQQQKQEKENEEEEGDDNNRSPYTEYEYFVIRHYDPDLYKQQKLDRKRGTRTSRADGKIECGLFKETDLPPIVVEELRRKKERK